MLKIDKILDALEEDDRRAVAYEVYRTYGGGLVAPRFGVTPQEARRRELLKDADLRSFIKARDRNQCRYCLVAVDWNDRKSPTGATYDHVDPHGDNSAENVVVSCHQCNITKNQRTPEQAGMRLAPEPNPESDSVSDPGPRTAHPDIDVYVAPASGSKKKPEVLNIERLEHAKTLLEPADFEFLVACPEPFRTHWLVDAEWWVSLRDGYPKIPAQQQASRYMAWPGAKRKKDHRAALRNWFSTADRWRERDEQRQAVRR